jgi:hypothetical protein
MRNHTRIQRVAFGMGMMAAMGFGAVQATAAPGQVTAAACTPEQDYACMTYCLIDKGGDYWSCGDGRCICW